MNTATFLRPLAVSMVFFSLARFSPGQPSQPPRSTASEEVVALPEFSVSAAESGGYTARDTVSGSRTNTQVKDLPYSVTSITQDFIKDFSLFDLTDDLSYISSINSNDDSAAFTARGFTGANTYLRNGHQRLGLIDPGSVDRVEFIKGPSGSIYGQTNPGGSLLVTTRRPTNRQREELDISGGSYHLNQDQLHLSGPVPVGSSPWLYYGVDATYLHRKFAEPDQTRFTKAAAASLVIKPDAKTDITLEFNRQIFKNPNEWALPYAVHTAVDPVTGKSGTVYDRVATELAHLHYASPVDYKERSVTGYTATVQHRFNDWLSGEGSFDHYSDPIETYDTVRSSNYDPVTRNLIGRSSTPTYAVIYGSGHSESADLLAHFNAGPANLQTLFTVDDYLNNRRDYANSAIAGAYPAIPSTLSVDNPVYAPYDPQDRNHFTVSTTRNNAVDSIGFSAMQQANLWHERLILYAGYRHDHVSGYQLNPSVAAGLPNHESHIHDSNDGGRYGFSYKLTPRISWYASRFDSFIPFGTSVPIGPTDVKANNPSSETGVGYETGFKGEFAAKTINWGVDLFDTKRRNVGVTELSNINDPSSPTVTINEGDQHSKGVDADADVTVAARLHWFFNYSYTDSRVSNQGVNVFANGRRPRATPFNAIGSGASYLIGGGLSATLGLIYRGNTPQESPSTGLLAASSTSKLLNHSDGRAMLRTPAYADWNAGLVYRWRQTKFSHRLTVQVKNLTDKVYWNAGHVLQDGRSYFATYAISH
jgi:iron complex outermembrane receptor protein